MYFWLGWFMLAVPFNDPPSHQLYSMNSYIERECVQVTGTATSMLESQEIIGHFSERFDFSCIGRIEIVFCQFYTSFSNIFFCVLSYMRSL
jgi:hypothetical protein